MMLPLLPAQPTQRQPPTAMTRGAKSCRRRPRLFPSRRPLPLPLPLPPQPQPRSSPAPPTSLTGILQHAVAPQRHTLTLTPLLPSSCSGYMMKQRRRWGLGPGLQQRWFVLDNCRLMWFAGNCRGGPPNTRVFFNTRAFFNTRLLFNTRVFSAHCHAAAHNVHSTPALLLTTRPLADAAHAALPSAFDDALASSRCITLQAGSCATTVPAPGGGQTLHVKDALGQSVSMTPPEGGSASQLDMWRLMINKVRAAAARHAAVAMFSHQIPLRAVLFINRPLLSFAETASKALGKSA